MGASAAVLGLIESTAKAGAISTEMVDPALIEQIETLVLASGPGNPKDREAYALLNSYGLLRFMRQARVSGIDTGALRIAAAGCILERSIAQGSPHIERMQAFTAVQLFYWGYLDRQERSR